jgi:hypothetical protein
MPHLDEADALATLLTRTIDGDTIIRSRPASKCYVGDPGKVRPEPSPEPLPPQR